MKQGWIKLHRRIMESDTFKTLTLKQKIIAIYLLLNVNHKDGTWTDQYKGLQVEVKRGQVITSPQKIADEWFPKDKEITRQVVRTTFDKLEKLNFLTKHPTNDYTLINIVNYSVYQSLEDDDNQEDNQVLTKSQPSVNQALTTNKNVKNVKNDKELINYNDNMHSRSIEFFTNNFGQFSTFINDSILAWENDLNPDLIISAMKIALQRNKRNFGYVESILKDWHSEGIKTLEQARSYETNKWEKPKRGQEDNQKPIKRNKKEAPMPKWAKGEQIVPEKPPEEVEKRAKELEAFLNNL